MKRLLLALGNVAMFTVASFAASYTWNDSSGNWTDASRWIPNGVPGPTDGATINGGQVTVSADTSVDTLNLNGGTLNGTAVITIGNVMNWTAGDMTSSGPGAGRTVIAPGATLNVGAAVNFNLVARTLENAGRMLWSGTANFRFWNGAVITNRPGAVIEALSDATLTDAGSSGGARLDNAGTFRKRIGTGTTTFIGNPFNNYGTLDIRSGIVAANAGYSSGNNAALDTAIGGTTPGTGFGQLTVSGNAVLNGTLNVSLTNGFVPAVVDTFLVVNSGARSGGFSSTSGLGIGGGLRLALSYPAQGALLTIVTLGIAPATLPMGFVGRPYSRTFSSVNGFGPYSFAQTGLPAEFTLSSAGVLSGTPSASGIFNFTVQVTDLGAAGQPSVQVNRALQVLSCGLADGLVSLWHGDGDAHDGIGTNHGTLQNGAGFASGKIGQGFSLDGVNDNIVIPSINITGAITVAAWIKPDSASFSSILSQYDTSCFCGTQVRFAFLGAGSGKLEFAVYGPSDSGRYVLTPDGVVSAGVFSHVAATFNPVGQEMKIYVNGVEVPATPGADSSTVTSLQNVTVPIRIGGIVFGGGSLSTFKGIIDEAGIYDRAISGAEVANLYNGGNPTCLDTPEFLTPGTLPNSRVGTPYWQSLSVLAGHPPYSYAVASGALPTGLTLSAAGLISGTPLLAGTATFTVTVTDALGNTAQQEFTISVSPQLPCVTIDGAWAHWPGESAAVETINGFNGALFNGATYTPGIVGQAFLFDGVDDYFLASVPYLASQQVGVSSDKNTTLEFWMRDDAPTPSGGAWTWVAGWDFGVMVDGNQQLGLTIGGAAGPVVELGRWYHIAAVYEDGYVKLYVDGALVASSAASFSVNNSPVNIGGVSNNRLPFKGAVDEPTIFTRALSAAEVRSIYDAGASGKCRSLNNTVPNSTCEIIAHTTADGQIRVRGLAFNPQNEPVVAWRDPGLDDGGVMWTARANGSWGTPHQIRHAGTIGSIGGDSGFALREDGVPFFMHQVPNVYIGNDSYITGVYLVDGGLEPEGPGSIVYVPGGSTGGDSALAFAPGANTPDWVFWADSQTAYNGIRQPRGGPTCYDFVINGNGVHALFHNGNEVQLSRTPGVTDGPVIANGFRQVAGTVDGNNVFHALMSGVTADADFAIGKMVYAKSTNGTNWVFTDLGPGVDFRRNRAVGLAVNPNSGKPAIAYFRAGVLWYAELINDHWAQTAVGAYSGYGNGAGRSEIFRLAFDREGKPAIAVLDPGTTNLLLCRPAGLRHAPVAIPQNLTTPEDTPLAIGLTGTDPDGDALTGTLLTTPSHGTLTGTMPVFTYTPALNFFGADSFTFQVDDGHEGTSTATISINVTPVNDPPVADPQNLTTPEDTALAITLTANDVDDVTLTLTAISAPAHGVLTGTAPNFTYVPALNYNGPDSFTFTIADAANATSTATISIIVTPVNDAPAANSQSISTAEDTAAAIALTGSDIEGDALTFVITTPPARGTLSGTAPNLTYTPALNYNGPDSFVFEANDGHGGTSAATVSIMVSPVNDPPTANDGSAATDEDTPVLITLSGQDIEGDSLTFVIVSGPSHGTLNFVSANMVRYTPAPDYHGPDNFTFKTSDGQANSAAASVAISVAPVNDAPVTGNDSATTAEDTSVNIAVLANDSDVDGDTLTISVVTQGAHGAVLANLDGTLNYVPAANFNGSDSFTYTVTDAQGGSATATVNVTITPVNDDPTAVADSATTPEDTALTIAVKTNDSDVDGDALAVSTVTQGAHGSVAINPSGTVNYQPTADYNGSDSFTYTISDGQGGSATAAVNVTIAPVNDAPVASNTSVTGEEDSPIEIVMVASDVDADALTYSIVTPPQHGTLSTIDGNRAIYTAFANYFGPDSVTFCANDGSLSATGVVSITVRPVNDPPVMGPVSNRTVNEGQLVTFNLTATDAEGDVLTFNSATLPAGATLNALTGAFSWTPNSSQAGAYTVTFSVSDQSGVPDTKTITITVIDVPPAPSGNRPPNCSIARPSIGEIWPPNHKKTYVIDILGVTDPDGDPVSVVVTKILQDEPTNTLGDGDTWIDGGGIGTARAWIRAERSGTPQVPGNGRIYEIFFTVSDGKGGQCSSSVKVGVPHDQGHGPAIDDGVRYDSTVAGGPRVN